jgi:hypothetical protein
VKKSGQNNVSAIESDTLRGKRLRSVRKKRKGGRMKIRRTFVWVLAGLFALLLAAPPVVFSQGSPPDSTKFKQEELDQMLAPVALYPDALLAQVLMAATYPLEVVEADRWVKNNKNLKGDALNAQVDKQTWDTSVKSLASFPQVLSMMSDKVDWTQKLGDAFLAQQKQVMDTVQKLRSKAYAQGTLTTTTQQKVVVQEQVIQIVPASPTVVYVPAYNPAVVYGTWPYPAYPPYPVYSPGAMMATSMVSFGLGVAVGAAWSNNWGSCNWHNGDINVNKSVTVNNNTINNANIHPDHWQHDPNHRRGVAYRDPGMAQRYGQPPRGNADGRHDYRGYDGKGGQQHASNRPGPDQKVGGPGMGSPKPAPQTPKNGSRSMGADNRQTPHQPAQANAFEGLDRGGRETAMNSDRGRTSRESMASSRGMSAPGGSSHMGSGFGGHRR